MARRRGGVDSVVGMTEAMGLCDGMFGFGVLVRELQVVRVLWLQKHPLSAALPLPHMFAREQAFL